MNETLRQLGPRMDSVNLAVWGRDRDQYCDEGWSDEGELAAFTAVADRVRGAPVLDLGVGAGRTISLLRLLSGDYVTIDYSPEMVELCRSRHPGVDVRHGDARDLSQFGAGQFGLVVFSYNGLDSIDHDGRAHVLDEVHRVLGPEGLFVFSTLNKDSPGFGASPATVPTPTWMFGSLRPRPPRQAWGPADATGLLREVMSNWRRLRSEQRDEGDWGVSVNGAHRFGVLAHFITLEGSGRELGGHGFEMEAAFPCDRRTPVAAGERSTAIYHYLVARRI